MLRLASFSCLPEYRASRHSGKRKLNELRFVVLHSTEQSVSDVADPLSALPVARYFASRAAKGSAHLVVGDIDCYRVLRDDYVPWAAPPLNRSGYHVEIVGRAEWTRDEWYLHAQALERAARAVAVVCRTYGIPTRFLGPAELKRLGPHPDVGHGGVTTHAAVSRAFGQSDHSDPGPRFPISFFMRRLRVAAKGLR